MVFIPRTALKNCISESAKYLSLQIQGQGKSTYTKHFEAGLMVLNEIELGINKKDVQGEWLFLPSDGKRGGTKRVEKCFPYIDEWSGEVEIRILDDIISKEVFMKVLKEAGRFIGLLRFRPRNNGYYGRFEVELLSWEEEN